MKMIEWKEHEHEVEDMDSLHVSNTTEGLRRCVLLKFFKMQGMSKQVLLLQRLISM